MRCNRYWLWSAAAVLFLFAGAALVSAASPVPAPPSGLTASVLSASRVALSWTNNATNATGLLAHESQFSNFSTDQVIPLAPDATAYTFAGLSSETQYYFRVDACNSSGCAQSSVVSATTGSPGGFGQPIGFAATAISACRIDLGWDAQQATDHFEIKYEANASNLFSGFSTTSTIWNVNSYQMAGLSISTPYLFQVRAYDASGNVSAWSASAKARTMDMPAPGAPAFSSSKGGTGNAQMTLAFAWNGTVPASPYTGSFIIEEATSTDGTNFSSFSVLDSVPASLTSYSTAGSLNPSLVYKFQMKSSETSIGCAPSQAVYSAYATAIAVPTIPSHLAASYAYTPSNPPVNLSWNASKVPSSGQNYYEVWRGTSPSSMTYLDKVTSGTSYADASVASNTTYFYKVRACNENGAGGIGCSDFSNQDSRTVANAPQRLAATVSVIHTGNPSTADAQITWDNTFPEFNYYLERSDDGGTTFTQIGGAIAGPRSNVSSVGPIFDNGLAMGKTYIYRVRAYFGGTSYSDYSSPATLNLNIKPLTGWAWADAGNAGGVPHGIGWIKFDSNTSPTDGVPYGVYVASDGTLSGYAWSGLACNANENRPANSTCGYGWLSFNANELTGCPDGNCTAKYDQQKNQLSGWARFLNGKNAQGNGAWDGWVSLDMKGGEPSYAVYYNPTTKKFDQSNSGVTSYAWGSTVTGWMVFPYVEGDMSGVGIIKDIKNLQATSLDCVSSSNCPVQLSWTNPSGSNFKQIYVFRYNGDFGHDAPNQCGVIHNDSELRQCRDKLFQTNKPPFKVFTTPSILTPDKAVQVSIDGLNPGTTYSFFIRGMSQ